MVFRCRFQAGTVTERKQPLIFPRKIPLDNRADRMDNIAAGKVICRCDFRLPGLFVMALPPHQFRTGKPELYTGIGMDGIVDTAMAGIKAA